jgi:hypothetical protein
VVKQNQNHKTMGTSEIHGSLRSSDLEKRHETIVKMSVLQSTETWKAQIRYFLDCDVTVQVIKLLTTQSTVQMQNTKRGNKINN